MGCDIHPYVERFIEGVWVLVYPDVAYIADYEEGEDLDKFPGAIFPKERSSKDVWGDYDVYSKHPFYIGRNYALFSKLADVRSDGMVTPLRGDLGLPDDVSPLVAYEFKRGEGDWHSASYFTAAELLAVDWNKAERRDGLVNLNHFVDYLNNDIVYYEEDFVGPTTEVLTSDAAIERFCVLKGSKWYLKEQQEPGFYFSSHKAHPYLVKLNYIREERKFFEKFVSVTIPALAAIGPPEHTRLVFWFDN